MFEYVASGISHIRLTLPRISTNTLLQDAVTTLTESIQNKYNHKYSFLYNAYTESNFPGKFKNVFGPAIPRVYSDSGGLQVLTLGKQFTRELKEKVYKNQAINSNFAMSFDEIPIETISDGNITSKNNKVFNSSLFIDYAKKSGNNLKEQIQMFLNLGSERQATILPIIQGNSIQGCKEWFKWLFDDLTEEERSIVSGLSFSMAAFGIGIKEELERIILMEELKDHYNHSHMLGLGSIQRFLPLLILKFNGFLQHISCLSYDSTSQTSNLTRGRYFDRSGKIIQLGRYKTPKLDLVINDVLENLTEFYPTFIKKFNLNLTSDVVYATVCQPSIFKKYGASSHPPEYFYIFIYLLFVSQVYNYIRLMDTASRSRVALENLIQQFGQGFTPALFSLLENVHSIPEFFEWERHIGKSLHSRKIVKKSQIDFNSMF